MIVTRKKEITVNAQTLFVKMMKLLFEYLAKEHFQTRQDRFQKLKNWVKNANTASNWSDKKAHQYDKAEELITFYTFAPFLLRQDKTELVNRILKLGNISETAIGEVTLTLEKSFHSPEGYLSWLRGVVEESIPVQHVREQAKEHRLRNRTLETGTHADAAIETANFEVFVEMKFTSDISVETTFNPYRNQLARLIDVGIEEAKKEGKKLILLLCSPSVFFVNKSRFYSYKITEYSDYGEIQKDIGWREQHEIEKYVSSVAWVPLESLIKTMYQDFNHPDKDEAMDFFRERKLA